jgi:hypothetical protein
MRIPLYLLLIVSSMAFKIQHIKTPCWTLSCYDQHYNSILKEINVNPGYLHHTTILYYSSLFTTIVYQ